MTLTQLMENTNFKHSRNVARLSLLLAEKAGYSVAEAELIGQAALFHDIGKTAIPAEVLNKPGRLTPEEFEIVKTHSAIGQQQINAAARTLFFAARAAREHHERLDGFGYHNLTENEIHPYSKVIAVADVFDALYSKRSYKEAWSLDSISSHFHDQAGKHFDRSLVVLLFNIIDEVLLIYNPA